MVPGNQPCPTHPTHPSAAHHTSYGRCGLLAGSQSLSPSQSCPGGGLLAGSVSLQSRPGDGVSSAVRRLSPGDGCWVSLSSAPKHHLLSGPGHIPFLT